MLDAVGGREVWRDAHGFFMSEILYTDQSPVPVIRKYWIDFEIPRIRATAEGRGFRQVQILNENSGWTQRNGETSEWSDETVNGWRSFWPGIPTRIFHLLASGDPSVTPVWRDGVIDFFIDGRRVVWIGLNDEGTPVAYGREDRHTETHMLGEYIDYGDVRLWSEAIEPGGTWRVVMVDYELMQEPHTVSFSPSEGQE